MTQPPLSSRSLIDKGAGIDETGTAMPVSPSSSSRLTRDEEMALVSRFKQGDRIAQHQLIKTYTPLVFGLLYRLTQNKARAEDLTHDVFVKLLEKIDQWDADKARLSTWLYTIAVNIYRDEGRKGWRWLSFTRDDGTDMDFESAHRPDDDAVMRETQQRVKAALNTLKPKERTAIILSYFNDYSHKEIAQMMRLSPKAVERLLAKTRAKLAAHLHDFMPTETSP